MTEYILTREDEIENTAGQKAKEDIKDILIRQGFKECSIKIRDSRVKKIIFTKYDVLKALKGVKKDDTVFIQYPIASRFTTKVILNECNKKNAKVICIIHDLESIRLYKNNPTKIKDEIKILKKFDCIISHNYKMNIWLEERGIQADKLISLEIFDYLSDVKSPEVSLKKEIIFAGNLIKSEFLNFWDIDVNLKVFGINPSDEYPKNIEYCGVRSPQELPKYLDGSFGLVWDGTSVTTNNGVYGEYTKYNNPHKVSLYLSCGLPVIVWKEAAVAKFVEQNNLGMVVSNLNEIPDKLRHITEKDYDIIHKNAENMGKKMRNGYFTTKAIKKSMQAI
ncbi:sugar transferase [Pediococcus acidilactici]|uniref:sugar transferase n=1 Tax=Pediococcus acidilactici TaxID=1254 RepID=UPI0013265A69|nr:sugar transferase [Pediococcus acidilactici]KAF0383821.1 hypothetical protein GBO64_08340 [Pediococcus acidilactici]KAF0429185.1 hypothetical protein GBO87_08340 [Pediococcus acidilactici]KAF0437561.1 hypothetical protein GBO94_08470 [Pediococcus acidilactici]